MPRLLIPLLVFLAAAVPTNGAGAKVQDDTSPIRRVVAMLQGMQQKIMDEGKKDKELFDKSMCYCESAGLSLSKDVEAAKTKLPQLDSSMKEGEAEKARLEADVKKCESDRTEAQDALKEGQELRTKQAEAFEKDLAQNKANVKSLGMAIGVLSKNAASGFLQTGTLDSARRLLAAVHMSSSDRDAVESFLSQDKSEGESPAGSEIVGMLKQMKESMETDMQDAAAAEKQAAQEFSAMKKAKEEQIASLTKEIKVKTARVGQLGMELANMKGDFDDTSKSLKENEAFLATLDQSCTTKRRQMAEREKLRTEELTAISETIKMLNAGEVMSIFKRTLPTPVFLQMQVIRTARHRLRKVDSPHLHLLVSSLLAKGANFDKIIKMVEGMANLLNQEQTGDDEKREYCQSELARAEDRKKELDLTIADIAKTIEEGKAKATGLEEEIATLMQGIQVLDNQVAEATKQRKAEHEEFINDLAGNKAAHELLVSATRRLEKFYKPAKPGLALDQTDSDANSNSGSDGTGNDLPEAVSFLQVRQGDESDVDAEPPLAEPYKKSQDGSAVIKLLSSLVEDLEKEIQEMKAQEAEAQSDYEAAMKDAAQKRASDARNVAEKEGIKADVDAKNQKVYEEIKSKKKEAVAAVQIIQDLHQECDALLRNYDARKKARNNELRGLRAVKTILNGGEPVLVQRHRGPGRRTQERDFSLADSVLAADQDA